MRRFNLGALAAFAAQLGAIVASPLVAGVIPKGVAAGIAVGAAVIQAATDAMHKPKRAKGRSS